MAAVIKINDIIYGSTSATDIFYNEISVADKLDEIISIDVEDNIDIDNAQNDNLTYSHIIDNLTSDDTNKVLSAKQGKILNEKFNNIDFSSIEAKINKNKNSINDNLTKINKNTSDITNNLTKINTNANNISTNTSNITTLNNNYTNISNRINSIINLFNQFTSLYKNKWLFELAATCSNTIESFNTKIPSRMVYIHDSATNRNINVADSYTAKATTWVRVDNDTSLTCTLETDDAGALFVNQALVTNLATCTPTSVTLPLKAGWNEIIVMYTEGSGGDGWIFTPRLSENSSIKEMNAICHIV